MKILTSGIPAKNSSCFSEISISEKSQISSANVLQYSGKSCWTFYQRSGEFLKGYDILSPSCLFTFHRHAWWQSSGPFRLVFRLVWSHSVRQQRGAPQEKISRDRGRNDPGNLLRRNPEQRVVPIWIDEPTLPISATVPTAPAVPTAVALALTVRQQSVILLQRT